MEPSPRKRRKPYSRKFKCRQRRRQTKREFLQVEDELGIVESMKAGFIDLCIFVPQNGMPSRVDTTAVTAGQGTEILSPIKADACQFYPDSPSYDYNKREIVNTSDRLYNRSGSPLLCDFLLSEQEYGNVGSPKPKTSARKGESSISFNGVSKIVENPEKDSLESSDICAFRDLPDSHNDTVISPAEFVEYRSNRDECHDECRTRGLAEFADSISGGKNDELRDSSDGTGARAPDGRRIMSPYEFFENLKKQSSGHECHIENVKMAGYCDRGLRTKITFVCGKCDWTTSIWTDSDNGPTMSINESLVLGTLTSGTGHATATELLASMEVPSMAADTYRKYRDKLHHTIADVAEEEMQRAAQEEARIAIEKGDIVNGIPMISVVADGSWAKRSYATGLLNSLSGVGMILGHATGKALFVGVRNKYCSVHARAKRLGKPPPAHVCSKNWSRKQSSTSMERSIIVDGFKKSIEKRKLIYKTLISDGDSSTFSGIIAADPYAMHGIVVEKIACNNHLFRNLCKKIRASAKKKIPQELSATLPMKVAVFRGEIAKSGLKIRKAVECARDLRQAEDIPETEKNRVLQQDIFTVLGHVLGDHSACNSLPFACEKKGETGTYVQNLRDTLICDDLFRAVSALASHARSLVQNVTNNIAEACNSIINKCIGGKRINFRFRNSYEIRCLIAMLQYNSQQALSKIHGGSGKAVPITVLLLETNRARHASSNKMYRQESGAPNRMPSTGMDESYGSAAEQPDDPPDVYEISVINQTNKMKANQIDRDRIERLTILQRDSACWNALRREMITASNFGAICRMRSSTSCAGMVSRIRLGSSIDTDAVRYGIINERAAIDALQSKIGKKILPCGLYIDKEFEFLGATPDGLIGADGIVEIKCPYSAKDTSLKDALQHNQRLRSIFQKNNFGCMSKTHPYYYQVQGQLRITERKYCIFALWTAVDLISIVVKYDPDFWHGKILPALTRFWKECLLPEIANSRLARSMKIREPEYILKARDELKRKKGNDSKVRKLEGILEESMPGSERLKSDQQDDNSLEDIDPCSHDRSKCQPNSWIAVEGNCDNPAEARVCLEVLRSNIPVEKVIENVSLVTEYLSDSSIDMFLGIVQENSEFRKINPVSYTAYASLIEACGVGELDMQIIGGNKFRHWCCLYYNRSEVLIYDSLGRPEYALLHEEEKRYIQRRYGHVDIDDIYFIPVTTQPDGFSCGVYSAAFATSLVLGVDPKDVAYSRDAAAMRAHFVKIIKDRKLAPFPTK